MLERKVKVMIDIIDLLNSIAIIVLALAVIRHISAKGGKR